MSRADTVASIIASVKDNVAIYGKPYLTKVYRDG